MSNPQILPHSFTTFIPPATVTDRPCPHCAAHGIDANLILDNGGFYKCSTCGETFSPARLEAANKAAIRDLARRVGQIRRMHDSLAAKDDMIADLMADLESAHNENSRLAASLA